MNAGTHRLLELTSVRHTESQVGQCDVDVTEASSLAQ